MPVAVMELQIPKDVDMSITAATDTRVVKRELNERQGTWGTWGNSPGVDGDERI